MDLRYEAHCFADCLFYDVQSHAKTAEGDSSQVLTALPEGWTQGDRTIWRHFHPAGVELPRQGWKVRVSATVPNAGEVLPKSYEYLVERRTPFKYLRTRSIVLARNPTLAGLVTGVVEPQAGVVRFGGVPVRPVAPEVRYQRIALVPQETYLFTGTVRENLALFAPSTSDAALLEAVAAVGASDLVARLGGLAGTVGRAGGGLSGGEAQLLAAARVYASTADVVIPDEAASALDPAAEAVVEQAFAARGGTLVVIAHRLSSALRADLALLVDGGPPLLGGHDELMATSPLYRDHMAAWQPTPTAT